MAARVTKPRKPDHLLGADLVANVEAQRVQSAVWDYDQAVRRLEDRWGVDRLPYLVGDEMRLRWWSAVDKLNAAIRSGDSGEVRKRVDICLRGLDALEQAAIGAGAKPLEVDAWETPLDDGRVLRVVRHDHMARKATETAADGRQVIVWSLSEVGRVIGSYGAINAIKDMVPEASVTAVRTRTPLEEELNDELPF